MTEWLEHYHIERPHQAKENDLLVPAERPRKKRSRTSPPANVLQLADIRCEQCLDGLLKHYRRSACAALGR